MILAEFWRTKESAVNLEGVTTYYNALVRGAKWSFIVSNMQLTTYTVCKIDTLGRQGGKSDSDGNKLIIKQTGKSVDEAKRLDLLTLPFLIVITHILMITSMLLSSWIFRQITVLLEELDTRE